MPSLVQPNSPPPLSTANLPPRCLAALLPARFRASDGLHRAVAGAQVLVSPAKRGRPDRVDLTVRFFPSRGEKEAAPTPAAQVAVTVLQQNLESPEAQTRSVACQALGQTGAQAALPRLLQLASEDRDPFVRQVAGEAVERIESSAATRASFTEMALTLHCKTDSATRAQIGPVHTDACGTARFSDVPADAECELALLNPLPSGSSTSVLAELARLLGDFHFSDGEPAARQEGIHSVSVQPHATGEPDTFSALLRLRPAPGLEGAQRVPGMAVRRGVNYWPPTLVNSSTGLLWFHRLPRGEFVTHLSEDWPLGCPQRSRLYALSGPISSAARTLPSPSAPAQIVHLPDKRLVAIVEQDRQGGVVLTVETTTPELRQARIRYLLGSEQGEFGFSSTGPRQRVTVRLGQAYRGDEAARLALQVAPCLSPPSTA